MRIVNRAAFLAMSPGTVFAKFSPNCIEAPAIKWDTVGEDYVVQTLDPLFEGWETCLDYHDTLASMIAGNPSPPVDYDSAGRDGLFDKDQLFAVWSEDDHVALIAVLVKALGLRMADR